MDFNKFFSKEGENSPLLANDSSANTYSSDNANGSQEPHYDQSPSSSFLNTTSSIPDSPDVRESPVIPLESPASESQQEEGTKKRKKRILGSFLGGSDQENYESFPSDSDKGNDCFGGVFRNHPMRKRFKYYIPILGWLPKYKFENLQYDVIAGLALGILVAPQSLAYANLVGVPPIYGLQTAFYSILIYVVLGTSKHMSIGPEAIISILVAGTLDRMDVEGKEREETACILAFLAGLFTLLLGLFRFGFLAYIFSRPILCGFINAVALEIIFEQTDKFFQIDTGDEHSYHKIPKILDHMGDSNMTAFGIGIGSLAFLLAIRFLKRKYKTVKWLVFIPDILIVVIGGTMLSYFLDLEDHGLDTLGHADAGFLTPDAPKLTLNKVQDLAPDALIIAIIGIVESYVCATTYANKHKYRVSSNRELVATGMANFLGSFFKMFPAYGSLPRTSLNDFVGCKSLLSTFVSSIIVLFMITLILPLFQSLPIVIMGSIITNAAIGLFEADDIKFLWKVRAYQDLGLLAFTFGATLFLGVELGIGIAITISLFLVVKHSSAPHLAILKHNEESKKFEEVVIIRDLNLFENKHYFFTVSNVSTEKGILMVRIEESLYFANILQVKEVLGKLELRSQRPLQAIILDCSNISDIDTSAAHIFIEMCTELKERGITISVVKLRPNIKKILFQCGLIEVIGAEHVFAKRHDAMNHVQGHKVDYSSHTV